MKLLLIALGLSLAANAASTWNETFVVSTNIPDNSIIGLANTRTVTTGITNITGIQIGISLTGGWNGDLYAYLSHAGGFCVLLNRPGRSATLPDGSGSSGLDAVFNDTALLDLHTSIPSTGLISGTYQPDARNVDPSSSLDTTTRSAFLNTFLGLDANGEWTLFIADTSPGGTATLQSWTLSVTGVPEPSACLLFACGALLLVRRHR